MSVAFDTYSYIEPFYVKHGAGADAIKKLTSSLGIP